jgi:hypothetical protein
VLVLPLSDFAGSDQLEPDTTYYWRMRASDPSGTWSAWSSSDWYFEYGTPPLTMQLTVTPGSLLFRWDSTGARVRVQWTPSLTAPDWQSVGDATWNSEIMVPMPADSPVGFYRLITE